ncbi:MAG: hypothetical protein ACK5K7_07010 [Bacilli bacterium]
MNFRFESSLFDEYKTLKNSLLQNREVLELVKKRNDLHSKLCEIDQYSSKYKEVKEVYDDVSKKLSESSDYSRFKYLERELNLFVLYCNQELEKLFDLSKKGCKK